MRLLQITIATLISLSTWGCKNTTDSNVKSAALQCEVAAAYAAVIVARMKDRPTVFGTYDEPFMTPINGFGWYAADGDQSKTVAPPPVELVRQLEKLGNRNAIARCTTVRDLLDQHRIRYGQKATAAVNRESPDGLWNAANFTVSLPVISADGRLALLASSQVAGPSSGNGFLELLERQADGKWKMVATSVIWVA